MKFGQLIYYSMRKGFFLKKPYTEYSGETRPRPLSEKIKIE